MFKGKKEVRQKKPRPSGGLSQLGIFEIPDIDNIGADSMAANDDDDLEAELMALMSSSGGPPSKPALKPKPVKTIPSNLDSIVAESLKDVPSDDDVGSVDENDPELLAELNAVTGTDLVAPTPESSNTGPPATQPLDIIKVLNDRINNYKEAEAYAKDIHDTAKSRRLGRGLKTLGDLLKKAQNGTVINEEDIPLPVTTGAKKPAEESSNDSPAQNDDGPKVFRPAPPPPVPPRVGVPLPGLTKEPLPLAPGPSSPEEKEDEEKKRILSILTTRRDEYKKAALIAKRNGDTLTALGHIKIIKQFEVVIAGVEAGQPADLSSMPPPPSHDAIPTHDGNSPPKMPKQSEELPELPKLQPEIPQVVEPEPAEQNSEEPLTVLSALEQRLIKFKEQEETGKKDGNASKARRMGRIVKQYEDAIKLHKAGKPIPVDELPTPPGFPPIPVDAPPAPPSPSPVRKPSPLPSPVPTRSPKPVEETTEGPSPAPIPRSPLTAPAGRKSITRQEKQMIILLEKQKQFKLAALKAKQNGDVEGAKEYLRSAKGFDPLIEATSNGLPVDMDTLPVPPGSKQALKEESDFTVISISDCLPGSDGEIYERLLNDLQNQFKLCMETRNHYKSMGDVSSANKFEQLAVHTKKDLDTVRACNIRGDPVPRFRYEQRKFSIVRCNVDLGDNDLELTIVQGINYNVPNPKEIDTYVRYEFPSLNDDIKRDKTAVIYNTNNPTYETVFNIPIQRNVRASQRIFKRHAIKCEVWSRGGFLRSDTLIGTVSIKLLPLETKCTIHDSFDLMDGRKVVGGKLEVKVRIRHPIVTKQVEKVEEKWLIIL